MYDSMYDVCFVGGGIACLYAAYKLKQTNPDLKFIIMEKTNYIGGRVKTMPFAGQRVVKGAGIGRYEKDVLMKPLLHELDIKYIKVPKHFHGGQRNDVFISKCLARLEKHRNEVERSRDDFKSYAIRVLGRGVYRRFLVNVGYRDFEKADVFDTLDHYGFNDVMSTGHIMYIPWDELLEKLIKAIGRERIITKCNVRKISGEKGDMRVESVDGSAVIKARQVVVGVTVDAARKLLPNLKALHGINGQPFLRIYGQLSRPLSHIKQLTCVDSVIQKIIPINIEKNIYMIAYADNENALELQKATRDQVIHMFKGVVGEGVQVDKFKKAFWKTGTHYFPPLIEGFHSRDQFLKACQLPIEYPGVAVVGEMVSHDQGWTQGALSSVNKIIGHLKQLV